MVLQEVTSCDEKVLMFLRDFLEQEDVDPTATNRKGQRAGEYRRNIATSILCKAAQNKIYTNIVEAFLKAGTNPDSTDVQGKSALMHAAVTGNMAALQVLLPSSDVNKSDSQGCTALLLACDNQQSEAALELLEHKANPFIKNTSKRDAFTAAIQNGLHNVVCKIAKLNSQEAEHLAKRVSYADACSKGYTFAVKVLINGSFNQRQLNESLLLASKAGHLDIIKLILSQKEVKVNIQHLEAALYLYILNFPISQR